MNGQERNKQSLEAILSDNKFIKSEYDEEILISVGEFGQGGDITVRKENGKWYGSDGKTFMGYLTPDEIVEWYDKDYGSAWLYNSRKPIKSAADTLHCVYVSDIRPQHWTKQMALSAIKNSVTNYGCYDYNGRTGMILVGDFDDIYHFIESNERVVDEDYIYHWKEFDWDNAKKLDKRYIGEKPNNVMSSRKHKISSSQKGFENVAEGTQYDDYHIDTTGMGILDVEHIISEIEGRGNQAVLTVQTSDGATQHTQFTLDDWKKYKNAVNGVDEFSRNSGTKGAAITDVWVTEVKGGSYVRNSHRPIKSSYEDDETVYENALEELKSKNIEGYFYAITTEDYNKFIDDLDFREYYDENYYHYDTLYDAVIECMDYIFQGGIEFVIDDEGNIVWDPRKNRIALERIAFGGDWGYAAELINDSLIGDNTLTNSCKPIKSNAYTDGYDAYYNRLEKSDNPYFKATEPIEYQEWDRGWKMAEDDYMAKLFDLQDDSMELYNSYRPIKSGIKKDPYAYAEAMDKVYQYADKKITNQPIEIIKILDDGKRSGFFTFIFKSGNNTYQMTYDYGFGGEKGGAIIKKVVGGEIQSSHRPIKSSKYYTSHNNWKYNTSVLPVNKREVMSFFEDGSWNWDDTIAIVGEVEGASAARPAVIFGSKGKYEKLEKGTGLFNDQSWNDIGYFSFHYYNDNPDVFEIPNCRYFVLK